MGTGVDVLDHGGAGSFAGGLPQLVAVGAVVGDEEHRAALVRDTGVLEGAGLAPRDVPDHGGARAAAARLPQLLAVHAVVGGEEQSPSDSGQGVGEGGVVDVTGSDLL